MRLGTSRPSALHALLATGTVVLYAAGVTVLPAAHGLVEALQSERTLEAEHSQDCPTLHAGAACAAIAGLNVGHPSDGSVLSLGIDTQRGGGSPAHDASPAPVAGAAKARAPPLG